MIIKQIRIFQNQNLKQFQVKDVELLKGIEKKKQQQQQHDLINFD
jgi:hypothetical protein